MEQATLPLWQKLAGIGFAGALGSLARYGVAGWVQHASESTFPWGTVTVNLLGCFLFGLIWGLTSERFQQLAPVQPYVLTGFMGAFTTFSTYMFETNALLERGQVLYSIGNVALQTVVGIVLMMLGLMLARVL